MKTSFKTGATATVLVLVVLVVVGWYTTGTTERRGHHASSDGHSHSHADLEPVAVDEPYPTLSVSLDERPNGDRILHLSTENFTFRSPVDTGPRNGTVGHGHLFVDGESIAMFYEPRYVLPDFMPGEYELRVTLNEDGSHRPIRAGDRVVADTLLLTVPEREQ